MNNQIIETNIIAAANHKADHLNEQQQDKCVLFLIKHKENSVTYIDDNNLILNEYRKYCHFSGAPFMGDYFFKWLWDQQCNIQICKRIKLNQTDDHGFEFLEVKEYLELNSFDKSDKKFVAVCLSADKIPEIYNACDSDWDEYSDVFKAIGIKVNTII